MQQPLVAAFSLVVAAAGWYYMFYSRAAVRLQVLEGAQANRARQRLRQANGLIMFLLAVLFFAGFNTAEPHAFVAVWMGVFVLLALIVVLALVDIRMTWRMRRK